MASNPSGSHSASPSKRFDGFPFLVVVPWLMLASAMRFAGWRGGLLGLFAMVISDIAVFLAFLLAARAMIESTGGRLQLGRIDIREQILLGYRILKRVLLLLVAVSAIAALAVGNSAWHLMLGFDGIAFDQFTKLGLVWSSALAAIALLMVVMAERGSPLTLFGALSELARRANWMVPAILLVAAAQLLLHTVQGATRWGVAAQFESDAPMLIKKLIYFAFVVGFATVRLWATLAILTFALRESYRRTAGNSAAGALPPAT
jgi:hypothetical protein